MSRDRMDFRSTKEDIERKEYNCKAKIKEEKYKLNKKEEIEKSKEHR